MMLKDLGEALRSPFYNDKTIPVLFRDYLLDAVRGNNIMEYRKAVEIAKSEGGTQYFGLNVYTLEIDNSQATVTLDLPDDNPEYSESVDLNTFMDILDQWEGLWTK